MTVRIPLVIGSGQIQQLQSGDLLSGTRELLTAARTYYVRTDGSNSNTGLVDSAGGAFLTIQKAYDTITQTLDLGGQTVTIQVKDGTFTVANLFASPWTGGGAVTIQGNSGTPANVLISTTSADAFSITCTLPGALTIKDLKVQTTTSGAGVSHAGLGTLSLDNVHFGACSTHINAVGTGASINILTSYSVSGAAGNHILANRLSVIRYLAGITVTVTGTPAFTQFCRTTLCGNIVTANATFSGSATGTRYSVETNSVVNTGSGASATYFPGNVNGSTQTGGQYI